MRKTKSLNIKHDSLSKIFPKDIMLSMMNLFVGIEHNHIPFRNKYGIPRKYGLPA